MPFYVRPRPDRFFSALQRAAGDFLIGPLQH
jgi:hypothetical protein